MVGRVVSVKMQNTAVVIVESKKTHPIYRKSFKRSKKYLVDDQFAVSLGDVVIFEKIAPISKRKHWKITKVLGKDIVSIEQAELLEEAQEAIAEVMPGEEEISGKNQEPKEEESRVESLDSEVKETKVNKAKETKTVKSSKKEAKKS